MSRLRLLHPTPDFAPLTGTDDHAVAAALRCRAITAAGVDLTVVVPRPPGRDPESFGLARRLRPLDTDRGPVRVHEGALPWGGGVVFAVDEPAAELAQAALALAAARDRWPDLVHPGRDVAVGGALAARTDGRRRPAVLDPDPVTPGIDENRWRDLRYQPEEKAAARALARGTWRLPIGSRPLVVVLGPIDSDFLPPTGLTALASLPAALVAFGDGVASLPDGVRGFALPAEEQLPLAIRAADFVLLPHRSPPALSDLYPLRAGCVPIAPRVDPYARVLVDIDHRSETGSAILFDGDAVGGVRRAIGLFRRGAHIAAARRSAARVDVSWQTAGLRYLEECHRLLRLRESA
jgi:hypothetical protein